MCLENIQHQEIENMSLMELAKKVLSEKNHPMSFKELFDKVSELKAFTKEQKQEKIGQFYTELTIDGDFFMEEKNIWGLKRWYRIEKGETVPEPLNDQTETLQDDHDESSSFEASTDEELDVEIDFASDAELFGQEEI